MAVGKTMETEEEKDELVFNCCAQVVVLGDEPVLHAPPVLGRLKATKCGDHFRLWDKV